MDPQLAPSSENHGRKHKLPPILGPLSETEMAQAELNPFSIAKDMIHNKQTYEGESHPNTIDELHTTTTTAHQGDTNPAAPRNMTNEGDINPTLDDMSLHNKPKGSYNHPHPTIPISPIKVNLAYHTILPTSKKSQNIQYHIFNGAVEYHALKQGRGIDGHIYICSILSMAPFHTPINITQGSPTQFFPHVFSAYYDLPVIHTESSIQAFLAMNNKDNTLTRSQMLKTSDSDVFLKAQKPKIRGLEKMHVSNITI